MSRGTNESHNFLRTIKHSLSLYIRNKHSSSRCTLYNDRFRHTHTYTHARTYTYVYVYVRTCLLISVTFIQKKHRVAIRREFLQFTGKTRRARASKFSHVRKTQFIKMELHLRGYLRAIHRRIYLLAVCIVAREIVSFLRSSVFIRIRARWMILARVRARTYMRVHV